MRFLFVTGAVAVLILTAGCASSPGVACDPACSSAEAVAPGKDAQAAAAAATGGQSASNQPTMSDYVPASPATVWGRGEGDVSSNANWRNQRSQSGAPSVNQGLVLPNSADASNEKVSGSSPLISSIQSQIAKTSAQLDVAVATGNSTLADRLRSDLAALFDRMHQASLDTAKNVTNNYNFDGAIINQGVASSSAANADPAKTSTSDDGASTSEDSSVPGALKARGVIPGEADSLPSPPAGAVPEVPSDG